jgi:hypothetical protein
MVREDLAKHRGDLRPTVHRAAVEPDEVVVLVEECGVVVGAAPVPAI